MSDFFSNLIHRHRGTCSVVEPRGRSRFEIDGAGSAILLPDGRSGTVDTRDQDRERRNIMDRIPENLAIGPTMNPLKPQRIDPEFIRPPDDPADAADPVGVSPERRDDSMRPNTDDAIPVHGIAQEIKPHLRRLPAGQPDRPSAIPKTVEPTTPYEDNASHTAIHRFLTSETESRRALPRDNPKGPPGANPIEEAPLFKAEIDHRRAGGIENHFGNLLARLQGPHNRWPAECPKTNHSERPDVTGMDHTGDTVKVPAARPLRAASFYDEAQKAGAWDSDPNRQDTFDPDKRDISWDGLLEPPTGFFDRQSEFNRRWNELNRESPPEPVIHVTIGRIEVKATRLREPAQPRPRKKPSGVMSLDKYLSQFGRGGRG